MRSGLLKSAVHEIFAVFAEKIADERESESAAGGGDAGLELADDEREDSGVEEHESAEG